MPYIKQEDRQEIKNLLGHTPGKAAYYCKTVGELNYVITKLCLTYLDVRGKSYQTYNNIIGALECAKLELYRKQISDYEEIKINENGDL